MANILLVDDERSMRITLEKLLESDGHQVRTSGSVAEATQCLTHQSYDIVLCDVILPDRSGVDFLKHIKDVAGETQVIMMTGNPDVDTLSEIVRYGAVDYLVKPFNKSAMLRSVSNALRVKQIDEERRDLIVKLRSQYAQQEELTKKQSDLLHVLRHDIDNALIGAIALLETGKRSIMEYASVEQSLLEMLLHCKAVIQEIRDRERESHHDITLGVFSLRKLVHQTCITLGARASAKQIEICNNVADEVFVKVVASSFVIHVVNNVISNAIKFSYPGSKIDVSSKPYDEEFVDLIITDYGQGIGKATLSVLLDESEAVPTSTPGTTGELGTGYGLRHTKAYVAELGGSLQISSTPAGAQEGGHSASGTIVTIRVRAGSASDSVCLAGQDAVAQSVVDDGGDAERVAPDRGGAETQVGEVSHHEEGNDLRGHGKGIIVVEDAWPVSDSLCVELAKAIVAQDKTTNCHITYARTPPLPFHITTTLDHPQIVLETIPERGSAKSSDQQLREAIDAVSDESVHLLIVQERSMLKALYALSGDDDFRNHLAHRFSVLAADYALGQKFSGTDLSRRMEGLLYRVLVSANPVGHLPDGFAQDCDARIDKSSVKMTTLAQKILAFDGTPVGLNG